MINTARASIRIVVFFIVSLLTVVLVAIGNLLLGIFGYRWVIRWKNLIIGSWARITAWIIGLKIKTKGSPPDPPFFLVSNHLSYIDVVPLWQHLDATFIAKSEIKSWPFFGWGTRTLGVLFIDRELRSDVHRMNQRISHTISSEQGIILFPEGTSTRGEQVLPFNTSLLQYPAENQMPVSYATITYRSNNSDKPADQYICWWGDMPFFSHFWEMLKIPGFEAEIRFSSEAIMESDRKILAQKLYRTVSDSFIPVLRKHHQEDSVEKNVNR